MSEFRKPFWIVGLCALTITPTLQAKEQFTLLNGDVLTGEFIKEDGHAVYIEHDVLGEMMIPKTMLAVVPEVPEEEIVAEVADEEDSGLFGTGILQNWERRFDIGITGSAGKSDNNQINVAFTADYESERTRISHKTSYYRSESEGDLSSHTFNSKVNRDWLLPETPWFRFAGAGFDWDEFKDYDYRVNANTGMGYEFFDTDTFLLVGRTGLGFNQTFGDRDEFTPEGLLGVETKWDVNAFQHIKFTNTLYPNLKTTSEYRNLTTLDWVLDLNTFAGVALKLGLSNEYDAAVEDDTDKNDFKYTFSLSWHI